MNAEFAIRRLQVVVRRQQKALSTEETYVYWLRRYIAALPRYPATMTSEKKVERFLSDLVRHRDISASSYAACWRFWRLRVYQQALCSHF